MSLSKANKSTYFAWLKHPGHYLFFKIFIWFWLTIIGTVAALIFLSNITAINAVTNEPLYGPMKKNLIYTAKSIERTAIKHKRSLSDVLVHPRLSKRKLLYLSAAQSEDSLSSKEVPESIDLSLLNFTQNMSPQIIFTEKYQAFGPVNINVPEGSFYLYEIDINHQPPLLMRFKLMPNWMKIVIAIVASLILSFVFSRNLIAPINSLKKAAIKLSAGNLSARADISVNRKDELGILGRDFNSMANQLELLISSQKR